MLFLRQLLHTSSTSVRPFFDPGPGLRRDCFGKASAFLRHFFDILPVVVRQFFDSSSTFVRTASAFLRLFFGGAIFFNPIFWCHSSATCAAIRNLAEDWPVNSRSCPVPAYKQSAWYLIPYQFDRRRTTPLVSFPEKWEGYKIALQFPYDTLFVELIQTDAPQELERKLLVEYATTFGEVPPLNAI